MKFTTKQFYKPCGCRSIGECNHNLFAWQDALFAAVDAFAAEMKRKLNRKHFCCCEAITAAAPEIARAVLELAARRCEKEHRYDLADVLRQMAKELRDGK